MTRRTEMVVWGLWLSVGLSVRIPAAYAAVPHLIRYQGQVADSQGVPLEGPYRLTFRLYDAATAGAKLWEELQPNIPLTTGHFSVLLGQVTPLTLDWSQSLWLSVQVGTEPELSPRQQITSVPLAIRAERAEQLTQPITPALITPQGTGSNLDADTVDSKHASDLTNRANHTGTQTPSTISPQGSGSGLDADTVDGKHASDLLKLNDAAGGDLSRTYPNPTVVKIQGRDVQNTSPSDNQVLKWVNANNRWEPSAISQPTVTFKVVSGVYRTSATQNESFSSIATAPAGKKWFPVAFLADNVFGGANTANLGFRFVLDNASTFDYIIVTNCVGGSQQ